MINSKSYIVGRKEQYANFTGLVVIFCVCFLPGIITNVKFDKRMLPTGYKTDYGAMSHDLAMGKSKNEVISKANRGGYDVKK